MGTFLEGIEAIRLPCTLALLLPAVAFVLASGRRAPAAVAAFVVGAGLLAWARAAGHWSVEAEGLNALLAAGVLAVAAAAVLRFGSRRPGVEIPTALAAGGVIGWLWRPCVGAHLGTVLTDAPDAPVRTFLLMIVYMTGACLIAVIVAATPVAFPRLAAVRDHRATIAVGAVGTAVVALLVAMGLYDNLVAELLRRSTI